MGKAGAFVAKKTDHREKKMDYVEISGPSSYDTDLQVSEESYLGKKKIRPPV